MRGSFIFFLLIFGLCVTLHAHAQTAPTPTFLGALGLNIMPSARMDPAGSARVTAGTIHPYTNGTFGLQLAPQLSVAVRQSAQSSSPFAHADALYPGLDVKLRLHPEGPIAPAIALGLQSAAGQRRLAGEYLVASKRWWNFDVSAGAGWGSYGAGHLPNPLGIVPHFRHERLQQPGLPNNAADWFTGHTIGLMAGVEYDVPFVNGLAFKADYGGQREVAPWSVGVAYSPLPGISVGTALAGHAVMATLSLQGALAGWPPQPLSGLMPMNPFRAGDAQPAAMERAAAANDLTLYNARADQHTAWALLDIDDTESLPLQLGRAARPMANHAGTDIDQIAIVPVHDGLRGPAIVLTRSDLEAAMARNSGSPQEIWRDARFNADIPPDVYGTPWYARLRDDRPFWQRFTFHLRLDNQVSLAERDTGLLYYESAILGVQHQTGAHIVSGTDIRLNLADNLEKLAAIRPQSLNPVRSDIAGFANRRVGLDRLYTGYLTSLTPNLHFAASAGLLEQMYSGFGSEVLYRPFGRTWAVGAEGWLAEKRDYRTVLALSPTGQEALTGHIKFYYEIPDTDLTLGLKAGRYLAGDLGGTASLDKNMANGIRLGAFLTATNRADTDALGAGTNLYSGLRLILPLGGLPYTPRHTDAVLTAAPLGRDAGQTLDNPLPLYELTEPLSYRHIVRNWPEITN